MTHLSDNVDFSLSTRMLLHHLADRLGGFLHLKCLAARDLQQHTRVLSTRRGVGAHLAVDNGEVHVVVHLERVQHLVDQTGVEQMALF